MLNWIKRAIYALPFGLKAANEEINSSAVLEDGGVVINDTVSDKSVYKDLLNGEVTQEVEELRYKTYEVAERSKEYNYIGNGVAVKKELRRNNKHIRFTQPNGIIVTGILEELKRIGDYGTEKYNISIEYSRFVRFKVEEFITNADVDISENGTFMTLHFNSRPNPYNPKSMPFINELKKIKEYIGSKYALERSEIANVMTTMSFVTYNATNDYPDMMSYVFVSPELIDYNETSTEVTLKYQWAYYKVTNLKDKFYSATQAKKYEERAKKDTSISMPLNNEKVYCSVCGEEINKMLIGPTDFETNKPICLSCLKKKVDKLKINRNDKDRN